MKFNAHIGRLKVTQSSVLISTFETESTEQCGIIALDTKKCKSMRDCTITDLILFRKHRAISSKFHIFVENPKCRAFFILNNKIYI